MIKCVYVGTGSDGEAVSPKYHMKKTVEIVEMNRDGMCRSRRTTYTVVISPGQ